jgi:hypothetical protein
VDMKTRRMFLEAIKSSSFNPINILVFADWLEGQGAVEHEGWRWIVENEWRPYHQQRLGYYNEDSRYAYRFYEEVAWNQWGSWLRLVESHSVLPVNVFAVLRKRCKRHKFDQLIEVKQALNAYELVAQALSKVPLAERQFQASTLEARDIARKHLAYLPKYRSLEEP